MEQYRIRIMSDNTVFFKQFLFLEKMFEQYCL